MNHGIDLHVVVVDRDHLRAGLQHSDAPNITLPLRMRADSRSVLKEGMIGGLMGRRVQCTVFRSYYALKLERMGCPERTGGKSKALPPVSNYQWFGLTVKLARLENRPSK